MIVELVCPPTRRFVTLHERTGIKAETWRTWWNRAGSPSGEMIEGLAKAWPQFAFWLASGIADVEHGHAAPPQYLGVEKVNDNGRILGEPDERTAAIEFFAEAIRCNAALNQRCEGLDREGVRSAVKDSFAASNLRRFRRLRASQEETFKELDEQELALAYIQERRAPDIDG